MANLFNNGLDPNFAKNNPSAAPVSSPSAYSPSAYSPTNNPGGLTYNGRVVSGPALGAVPAVPVNVIPSTKTTSDMFAKPAKTKLDIDNLLMENRTMQRNLMDFVSTPDPDMVKAQQGIFDLQNQANDIRLSGQAGGDAEANAVRPMEFITGRQQVIQNNTNRALQANSYQQQPLVQNLQILSDNKNRLMKAYEMAVSFGKDDINLAMQLRKMERDESQAAQEFAMANAVAKPFYTIDGTTMYRTADGKAYSTYEEWVADGGKDELVQAVEPTREYATDDIAEYEYAASMGFQGSFMDWIAQSAASRRAPSRRTNRSGNSDFSDTQLAKGASAAGMSIEDFSTLDEDSQNEFINGSYKDFENGRLKDDDYADIQDEIDAMYEEDGASVDEVKEWLLSIGIPAEDRYELEQYAEENDPDTQKTDWLGWFR